MAQIQAAVHISDDTSVVAPGQGFEPRFPHPKCDVLPVRRSWDGPGGNRTHASGLKGPCSTNELRIP